MNCFSKKFSKICVLLCSLLIFIVSCEEHSPQTQEKEPSSLHTSCELRNAKASDSSQSTRKIIPQNEPLFYKQWYLSNTRGGIDINIVPVWEKGYGTKPIAVGILDSIIDVCHPDFTNSVLVKEFGVYNSRKNHGTNVAGILAARDNDIGIIGVAPRAKIYNYAILRSSIFLKEEHKNIAVYNISAGDMRSGLFYLKLYPVFEKSIEQVITTGFSNKGSNIVASAGNAFASGGSSAQRQFLNHYAVIGVNGIASDGTHPQGTFTHGQNIWIAAPTNNMTTTDNEGKYIDDFEGTSGAAPLVSGAIALLRSEYPLLTWRDVKLILAESAQKVGERTNYQITGKMYSNKSKDQNYHIIKGFGVLDVESAFKTAEDWQLLPAMKTHRQTSSSFEIPHFEKETPELQELLKKYKWLSGTKIAVKESTIQFIESVTIEIKITGKIAEPCEVFLTKNISTSTIPLNILNTEKSTIQLVTNFFLGSSADSTWELIVAIKNAKEARNIEEATITFRGH